MSTNVRLSKKLGKKMKMPAKPEKQGNIFWKNLFIITVILYYIFNI